MKCIKIHSCHFCPYMDRNNKICTIMELDYKNEGVNVSAYNEKCPVFCPLDDYPGSKRIEQQAAIKREKSRIYSKNKRSPQKKQKYYNACIGIEGVKSV